jgi:myo-inositol-1(or 4)-monophosphatase
VKKSNRWELALAVEAAEAARFKLEQRSVDYWQLEKIEGREWKSSADHELESTIISVLQEGSDYPILSEEIGCLAGKGDHRWIVDPLDGTANFLRGIPVYCISIGLWKNNVPELGVVVDVPNNRVFTGIVGVGAWCNESQIHVNIAAPGDPTSAVLCTGFPVGFDHSNENIHKLVAICANFGKVRMLGSAALMLCYVASGRCDSYWESRIRLWDIGAGFAIAVAAGGATKLGKIGSDFKVDVEVASNASLLVSELNAG